MATNTKKTYTIEIQLDGARQQLADATSKLKQLDEQLEGLDRDSDAAKAIIQQMAAAAKQVEGLTNEVGDLGDALDNLKPGTVGALELEVEELEAAFKRTVVGTKEQEEALLALGKKKGELKQLEDAVDALDPKMKAAAFVDFANGVVGAFGVATVAAETFGLSSTQAEEYQKKLLSLITVLDGVEQVSKAVNSETLAVIKSSVASAKSFLGIGQAAATSGKMTRAALVSTGIGALVVILGLVYANWESISGAVKRNKDSIVEALKFIMPPVYLFIKGLELIEKKFGGIKQLAAGFVSGFKEAFKGVGEQIGALLTGDFDGAAAAYEKQGQRVAEAFDKGVREKNEELAKERELALLRTTIDGAARRIAVLDAEGRDTTALKARQLANELKLMQTGTAEEMKLFRDKYNELLILEAQYNGKRKADQYASDLALLNGRIARLSAAGKDTTALQIQFKERELRELESATQRNGAAIIAKEAEIDAIRIAASKAASEKAIAAAQARDGKIGEQMLQTLAEVREANKKIADAVTDELADMWKVKKLDTNLPDSVKEVALKTQQAALEGFAPLNMGDKLLVGIFGVSPDVLDATKQLINQAFADISASVSQITTTLFAESIAAADAELARASAEFDSMSEKLDAAQSKRQATEEQLKTATGARRDYLLGKLQKERAEEERLAAAKAKAARQEEQAAKERQKLEKQQQTITAASTVAASAYNAVLAVQAALEAVKQGSKVPFPANIVAIGAGVLAVGAALLSARSFAKSLGDGGVIAGGSHASGNDVPVMGGRYRVEGGEMITPVDATSNNRGALELIRTQGRKRTLLPSDFAAAGGFRVRPSPTSRSLGDGGILGGAGSSGADALSSSSSSSSSTSLLEQKIDRTNELLAAVAQHTFASAAKPDPVLAFGPQEAVAADQQLAAARAAGAPVRL